MAGLFLSVRATRSGPDIFYGRDLQSIRAWSDGSCRAFFSPIPRHLFAGLVTLGSRCFNSHSRTTRRSTANHRLARALGCGLSRHCAGGGDIWSFAQGASICISCARYPPACSGVDCFDVACGHGPIFYRQLAQQSVKRIVILSTIERPTRKPSPNAGTEETILLPVPQRRLVSKFSKLVDRAELEQLL